MIRYRGKSVYKGIAMGQIRVLRGESLPMEGTAAENPEVEIARLKRALETAEQQLSEVKRQAVSRVGADDAELFEAYRMILKDEVFLHSMIVRIREDGHGAEHAAASAGEAFAAVLEQSSDEYMKSRAQDIRDITRRILTILTEQESEMPEEKQLEQPIILVADDLTPSQTIQLNREKILAFVTVRGTLNSHTAILARMLRIPAMVGVPLELSELEDGMSAVVDCLAEEIIFDPDEAVVAQTGERIRLEEENRKELEQYIGLENITVDGRKIELSANISNQADVDDVLAADADGIGLFRSEFLYVGRTKAPSEEEQFETYCQVLKRMQGRPVIIRTVDLGADKTADYLKLPKEENPALGYRAIRISLSQPELFRTQLRALLRAAAHGSLSIMYPLITSVEEVQEIREIVRNVALELGRAHINYRMPEQGIMIETPAAVMLSDELVQLVDFVSIGTNDLTQYTLAMDRSNSLVDSFYDPRHPAVIRMIRYVVENAHRHNCRVGLCGELAADPEMTETLLDMGLDELSVAPEMILRLRKQIRSIGAPVVEEETDMQDASV